MGSEKYLLLHITASAITDNPYKDIEISQWNCRMLYYAYFDKDGIQVGRSKQIKVHEGQALPFGLTDDIRMIYEIRRLLKLHGMPAKCAFIHQNYWSIHRITTLIPRIG